MAQFIVAITGGIASGKSAVSDAFARRGIQVADADLAARDLVKPGAPALARIVDRFGARLLQADGSLDRAALRRHVFAEPDARLELEAILHPLIRERLQAQCEHSVGAYAMVAIPLLCEVGGRSAYPWLERILVVDIAPELQRSRLQSRDNIDAALVTNMLTAQATREARLAIADDVIDNSGTLAELDTRVEALHRQYTALAGHQPQHALAPPSRSPD